MEYTPEDRQKSHDYYLRNRERILKRSSAYAKKHKPWIKNREQHCATLRKCYAKNRHKWVERRLMATYGITLKQYNQLVEKQKELCLICSKKSKLFIDHSHITGKVRGLLCSPCNLALGGFNDDKEIIANAVRYLESYS